MIRKEDIEQIQKLLNDSDAILIGAGAGLSTAAGYTYSGERFTSNFADFIEKYHFRNMYEACFYPFPEPEEYWAFWSRVIYINRYVAPPIPVYEKLYELIRDKNYFVLTTNCDHCFQRAGFDKSRLFYTQGDFGLCQCPEPCHQNTYDNESFVTELYHIQKDMCIPTERIPRCPKCGKVFKYHLRADKTFVEDEGWHQAAERYRAFIEKYGSSRILFIEIGVGYNSPGVIKYPFLQMTNLNPKSRYICINLDNVQVPDNIRLRSIGIKDDIIHVLECLSGTPIVGDKSKMTQEMRRTALIRKMLGEMPRYSDTQIPESADMQKKLLRALFNVRPAMPASQEFLELQDAYLQEEIASRGIVDAQSLPTVKKNSRIVLWQGDITRLKCGAIVNAANSALLGCFQPNHACIDNIIHTYAGVQLRIKCNEIMQAQGHKEPTGCAKITPGYNLPAQHVLHTVGPIIDFEVTEKDKKLLASCYRECLRVADENGVKSVAFCCISTGVFRFPQALAASIAVDTVVSWLEEHPDFERVIFNVFKDKDLEIYHAILNG